MIRDELDFLLTNRIPRALATRFMGWFSRIEHPLVRDLSLWVWRVFTGGPDLSDAREQRFASLHEVFVRELRPGARPLDPAPKALVSPCDGIVVACGAVEGTRVWQAKGLAYSLEELLPDTRLVERLRGGRYVTLRLTSTMYHRFHAPCAGRIRQVLYVSGDTWNVNPPALARIERLYCRNERAVLDVEPALPGRALALVPVAAILVASIRLHFLEGALDLRYRGPNRIACDARFEKGDELGYFQHGSTIIVFGDGGLELAAGIRHGAAVRMGEPLLLDAAAGTAGHEMTPVDAAPDTPTLCNGDFDDATAPHRA